MSERTEDDGAAPSGDEQRDRKVDTGPVLNSGVKLMEKAFRGSRRPEDPDTDVFAAGNFEQVENSWWLDRALPGDVKRYFVAAIVVCTVAWLIALTLRLYALGFEDPFQNAWLFIRDPQWQTQPLVLLVHFICLRLFKGIYSRNFDDAFERLDVHGRELNQRKKWFLGARVNLLALAVASPFIVWEWVRFATDANFYETVYGADSPYLQQVDLAARNLEAWFLLMLWTLEWAMYGFYCYLMMAGALVIRSILKKHDFKDSVDLVLTERQYRPMFNVTAQAGSLVFLYGLIHAGYMFYTKPADTDVAGLILLVVLLGMAFGMTWSAVRGELKGNVFAALEELEKSYRNAREKLATMVDVPGIEDDLQRIQVQLKMQLALQQLDYLATKYESLGRKEFLGLIFKVLAPVGGVVARVIRWGSLMAAIGLSGAAAIGERGQSQQQPTVKEAPAEPGESGE